MKMKIGIELFVKLDYLRPLGTTIIYADCNSSFFGMDISMRLMKMLQIYKHNIRMSVPCNNTVGSLLWARLGNTTMKTYLKKV